MEISRSIPDRALVRFEAAELLLLFAARESGVPLEVPAELSEGTIVWEVTAPGDRLSERGTQLRRLGLSFDIEYTHQEVADEQLQSHSGGSSRRHSRPATTTPHGPAR